MVLPAICVTYSSASSGKIHGGKVAVGTTRQSYTKTYSIFYRHHFT